jgi:hypothetical protein
VRGVTSQGSSAPYANNPSNPAIRRGANPTQPWRTSSMGGSGAKLNRCHLGGAGMGAAWADTRLQGAGPSDPENGPNNNLARPEARAAPTAGAACCTDGF